MLVRGALLLAVAASIAALAGSEATAQPAARGGLFAVAADYVGLTRPQLRAELRAGRTLAQIAAAHAKSRDGLVQTLLAAAEERLNARDLSAERKQAIRARLPQRIERLVDRAWAPRGLRSRVAKRGLLAAAAGYLGQTPEQLRAELRAGRSLAEVAVARGKSVDGLEGALLDSVKSRLDRRAGLSAERRQKLLARAERLIERLVHRKRS